MVTPFPTTTTPFANFYPPPSSPYIVREPPRMLAPLFSSPSIPVKTLGSFFDRGGRSLSMPIQPSARSASAPPPPTQATTTIPATQQPPHINKPNVSALVEQLAEAKKTIADQAQKIDTVKSFLRAANDEIATLRERVAQLLLDSGPGLRAEIQNLQRENERLRELQEKDASEVGRLKERVEYLMAKDSIPQMANPQSTAQTVPITTVVTSQPLFMPQQSTMGSAVTVAPTTALAAVPATPVRSSSAQFSSLAPVPSASHPPAGQIPITFPNPITAVRNASLPTFPVPTTMIPMPSPLVQTARVFTQPSPLSKTTSASSVMKPILSTTSASDAPAHPFFGLEVTDGVNYRHCRMKEKYGAVRVVKVWGPAQRAGIAADDFITHVNNARVESLDDFNLHISAVRAGDIVPFTLDRVGQELNALVCTEATVVHPGRVSRLRSLPLSTISNTTSASRSQQGATVRSMSAGSSFGCSSPVRNKRHLSFPELPPQQPVSVATFPPPAQAKVTAGQEHLFIVD